MTDRSVFRQGRLTAKWSNRASGDATTGIQPLQLDTIRDGLLYVPRQYHHNRPAALAVMLHGAGGQAQHGLNLLQPYADENNIILIAPASRESTWDIIAMDAFDVDVIFINQAVSLVFHRFVIDPAHIAIGGFSDGASYALCVGLSNGDLFTHIIAFSPGFVYTIQQWGKPAVFMSHGVNDGILPITPCSRRIVPQLRKGGYAVNYREFDGGHEVPSFISSEAVEWFVK